MSEWANMRPVNPRDFALLRVEDAADVLWNLCCWHGQAFDIVRALDARLESEATRTIEAMLKDLEAVA